jgi:hypothetical protein
MAVRRAWPIAVLLRTLAVAAAIVLSASDGSQAARLRKPIDGPWQYRLQGKVDVSGPARVFDIDGASTPAVTVRRLHRAGRYAICYVNVGASEDFRADHGRFPNNVIGTSNGWPGERWLDIRRLDILGPILEARMRTCAHKSFDAVEPDNVDGYANQTGFPLTRQDDLHFVRWLARTAHGLGLAVGLKNALELVPSLVSRFDFAVVEQCFEYNECDRVAPFVRRGKPVYAVEYSASLTTICPQATRLGINLTLASVELDGSTQACPALRRR